MIFGEIPLDEAEGAILVHSVRAGKLTLKKGRRLSAEDMTALREAGHERIVAVRLEADDIGEDQAAAQLAGALAGPNLTLGRPFTGRCNLHAQAAGLLAIDKARLDRINLVSEAITVATLAPFDVVAPKDLAATVKIIPFAVPTRGSGALHRHCPRGRPAHPHCRLPQPAGCLDSDPPARPQGKHSRQDAGNHERAARVARRRAGKRSPLRPHRGGGHRRPSPMPRPAAPR